MNKSIIFSFIAGVFLTLFVVQLLYNSKTGLLNKEYNKASMMALVLLDVAQIDQDIVELYMTYGTIPIEKREEISKLLDRKVSSLKILEEYMETK
jgi:hypothetical protein